MFEVLLGLIAIIILMVFVSRWHARGGSICFTCMNGQNAWKLPEVGVRCTAMCVRCPTCQTLYLIEATSPNVTVIDEKEASEFHSRDPSS